MEWWFPRAKEWGSVLDGDRVSVLQVNRVPEIDGRDGCATLWMHLIPQNCILTMS